MYPPTQILSSLKNYIANEILDGEDLGLAGDTPLLELGVLNSIEIVRLVAFIDEQFGVKLEVRSDNFKTLDVIAARVQDGLHLPLEQAA